MANGSMWFPFLVACILVSSSFQSLHRDDGDSVVPFLTLDMVKHFHGCDQNLELKIASCHDKGLDTVPQNLSEDTEMLDLSENNITKLLNSSFEVYPLINSLDISSNDVRAIESATFHPLKDLMYLSLSSNWRLVLPATGIFMMSPQLSFLDLTGSNLKSLPIDILKWSPHLDTAYLSVNKLSFIKISSCGMVDTVDMTGNQLQQLTAGDFTFVCHTDTLDLRKNPIQSVDPDVIASLHVRSLRLGGYRYSDEVLTNIMLGISKSDIEQLTILGGIVDAFPKGFFDPILVVISVLLYHCRWQLRYKLFLFKLAVLGYKEMRDARDHNDYEFDVNIIFYDDDEDDEEWIREQLRPALEERLPQFHRNVFGDEDLVLGMHYLDSVDYVVSHSYKTIITLSRAAVHDHWFILKFRTAMDHVSDTLTEFVVVVFLEDIPDDEMPFLARLCLSDGRPYIYWTENVRGKNISGMN
eukprot:XP_011679166.1 PREDICTED: toll-like receptor 13 [Strongylocentrotus purpuratus]